MITEPPSTFTPAGRTVSHERWAAIARALTPVRSLGRPGRCTSDADIIMVTAPCIELSIQPIIDWRGVQSANTTWACVSIMPGRGDGAGRVDLDVGRAPVVRQRDDHALLAAQRVDRPDVVAEPPRHEAAEVAHEERAHGAARRASSSVRPPTRAFSLPRDATATITTISSGSGASGADTVNAS